MVQSKHGQLNEQTTEIPLCIIFGTLDEQNIQNSCEKERSNLRAPASTIFQKVGDFVIIHDDGPPVEWEIGEVRELIPPKDGENKNRTN